MSGVGAEQDRRPPTAAGWALAAVLGLVATPLLLPCPGPAATTAAAVFPPWWASSRIWAAAASAGEIVDVGASRSVLVLHASRPGLVDRLRRAGALLILDPRLLGPCGGRSSEGALSWTR